MSVRHEECMQRHFPSVLPLHSSFPLSLSPSPSVSDAQRRLEITPFPVSALSLSLTVMIKGSERSPIAGLELRSFVKLTRLLFFSLVMLLIFFLSHCLSFGCVLCFDLTDRAEKVVFGKE